MQHQEFEPPKELQDAIKCFWHNKGNFGEKPCSFEVVPDGYAEVIFYFGRLSISKGQSLETLPSPFMMGLLNQPVVFYTQDHLEIIGIRCFPWTVFDLLEIATSKDGVHKFNHPIAQLQSILTEYIKEHKPAQAIDTLMQYFLDAKQDTNAESTLSKAGIAMREANGSMPVYQVAASAHTTVRTLERKFRQSSGHTVKDLSGLIRFEQVRNQLWLDPKSNLAGLAAELGYTDQAHLTHEFKKYSATTPAAFAKKARLGKQVLPGNFVALAQLKKDA